MDRVWALSEGSNHLWSLYISIGSRNLRIYKNGAIERPKLKEVRKLAIFLFLTLLAAYSSYLCGTWKWHCGKEVHCYLI